MSSVYESIIVGLTEAIDDVKRNKENVKINAIDKELVNEYNSEEVKKGNT